MSLSILSSFCDGEQEENRSFVFVMEQQKQSQVLKDIFYHKSLDNCEENRN
jgi:hypothetical protein